MVAPNQGTRRALNCWVEMAVQRKKLMRVAVLRFSGQYEVLRVLREWRWAVRASRKLVQTEGWASASFALFDARRALDEFKENRARRRFARRRNRLLRFVARVHLAKKTRGGFQQWRRAANRYKRMATDAIAAMSGSLVVGRKRVALRTAMSMWARSAVLMSAKKKKARLIDAERGMHKARRRTESLELEVAERRGSSRPTTGQSSS